MPTQDELKEILDYNPLTGIFTRLVANNNSIKAGDVAGCLSHGYIQISINNKRYLAHRVAWMMVHDAWPKEQIDHINHDKSDNRIANLREVTHQENCRNTSLSKANNSGVTGVCWYKPTEKWRAYIVVNGEQINLGYFKDFFEAVCARKSAENKHNFHANHGNKL